MELAVNRDLFAAGDAAYIYEQNGFHRTMAKPKLAASPFEQSQVDRRLARPSSQAYDHVF